MEWTPLIQTTWFDGICNTGADQTSDENEDRTDRRYRNHPHPSADREGLPLSFHSPDACKV